MQTTGKALVDHWSWAAQKGLMNKNTAIGLRVATSKVLSALDDWENVDVRSIDVDDAFNRFQNLQGKNFKPRVLGTYQQRWRQAVASFLAYVDDPAGWRPSAPRTPRSSQERNGGSAKGNGAAARAPIVESVVQPVESTRLMEYHYPLRDNQNVRLVLPRDLKVTEVKRLTAFMNTLVVDFDATA